MSEYRSSKYRGPFAPVYFVGPDKIPPISPKPINDKEQFFRGHWRSAWPKEFKVHSGAKGDDLLD